MRSRPTTVSGVSFSPPPLTPAVKWLIIANVAVHFTMVILGAFAPHLHHVIDSYGALSTDDVMHGWVTQLVTYGFLHGDTMHLLGNMLVLYLLGSMFEIAWGSRKLVEYYFWCLIGAAIAHIGVAFAGRALVNLSPQTPFFQSLGILYDVHSLGASGAIYGLIIALWVVFPEREFFIFPLPFMIKAKYIVTAWILIAAAGALGEGGGGGVAHFAHLGGALFGWLYLRFLPRRGLEFAASENYYGLRNRYYRWKRRRAARKFEVYMRKQGNTPPIDISKFEEQERSKRDGDPRGPWVN